MELKYDDYKAIIEDHIMDFIPNIDVNSLTLYEAMKYSLLSGGKRLRPVMLLAACDFAGGNITDALPFACALEYIHTYSLIHDDLPAMDDDDYRRGILTNHKMFGDAIAILAGDGLLSTAFESMYKETMLYFDKPDLLLNKINASYEIAKGCGCRGMVAGQVSDIENAENKCSDEMLGYINLNKTGALFVAAVRAGVYLGNGSEEFLSDLTKFAEYFGTAYQIHDDILDKDSDDINTYVSLYGLEKSKDKLKLLVEKAKASIAKYYDNVEFFRDLADSLLNVL